MCYPTSGYIIFSLRKLKFYGGRGLVAGGRITQTPFKIFELHVFKWPSLIKKRPSRHLPAQS